MSIKSKRTVIVITGPTAVGKTATSIRLAKNFGSEIISADSRQIYKYMDIGTAKPDPSELAEVPHHFINHIAPDQTYSTGHFEREALPLATSLMDKNKHGIVILSGGTGLYIKALLEGLDEFPDIPHEVRLTCNRLLSENGIGFIQDQVAELDPAYFKIVDKENPRRLIRALEVMKTSGKPFSNFLNQPKKERPFKTIQIVLTAPRDRLYSRINQRVDQMIETGLLDEVKSLLPQYEKTLSATVGYSELIDYIQRKLTQEEAIDKIKQHTRNYAKRQITWFKGMEDTITVPFENYSEILSTIEHRLT